MESHPSLAIEIHVHWCEHTAHTQKNTEKIPEKRLQTTFSQNESEEKNF